MYLDMNPSWLSPKMFLLGSTDSPLMLTLISLTKRFILREKYNSPAPPCPAFHPKGLMQYFTKHIQTDLLGAKYAHREETFYQFWGDLGLPDVWDDMAHLHHTLPGLPHPITGLSMTQSSP